ncbi:hypothetical protein AB4084_01105, partial [Lysobacter sp. 2RAB21]
MVESSCEPAAPMLAVARFEQIRLVRIQMGAARVVWNSRRNGSFESALAATLRPRSIGASASDRPRAQLRGDDVDGDVDVAVH